MRDVRLTVLADHRPVVFDHDRRVVVDAGLRLFVERHHQHHLVFFRQLLHTPNGGTVIGLGGVVPLGVLLGREVGPEKDLLQAGDLRSLLSGLSDQLLMSSDRLVLGHVRVRLD